MRKQRKDNSFLVGACGKPLTQEMRGFGKGEGVTKNKKNTQEFISARCPVCQACGCGGGVSHHLLDVVAHGEAVQVDIRLTLG